LIVSIDLFLSPEQIRARAAYRSLADEVLAPVAARHDREECMSRQLIDRLRQVGIWGAEIPEQYGGAGVDWITYGLLSEEVGRVCASVRNLLGVQAMVSTLISNFGTDDQKRRWLTPLASGEYVAAFALTEPRVGSDAAGLEAEAVQSGPDYLLKGRKRWISFGQIADLLLVFALGSKGPLALFVEKARHGFGVEPITGLLGFRGSMLAEIDLDGCRVGRENCLLEEGLGVSYVAASGLNVGRYSTAWGGVGLARACLEASVAETSRRKQFGVPIKDHQLVQRMLADMAVQTSAARLLCLEAGKVLELRSTEAPVRISAAKYFAASHAVRAAADCVQLHGANGCSETRPIERYLRDAKVLEIVEGTREIQQLMLARYVSSGRLH
jgi:alkylation response protein AidB-like acyl-CoA dehydrogenase